MLPSVRAKYNQSFSEERYRSFLNDLNKAFDFRINFRVAETPVFIPRSFRDKLTDASREIIDFLVATDLGKLTENAIPENLRVPNETDHALFLALDFAVTKDEAGEIVPQLIELQGFPSLFGFQDFLAGEFRRHFDIPGNFFNHFGLTQEAYRQKLTRILLGHHNPENVILLEIDPFTQNTAIDFIITQKLTGIEVVNIADVMREGRSLFYLKNGRRIPIHRIYNRVIFDELVRRKDLNLQFHLTEDVDVEWAGHPNWFYRISKFLMPFLKSKYVPECKFLNEYVSFPEDLENYVLKPLFSFSGSGVIFHVQKKDLENIPLPERANFILQRKVRYDPVIAAREGFVKAEIRLLFIWDDDHIRPELVTSLARLSRGEMIGVKFNLDKTWVGGTVCFFEP